MAARPTPKRPTDKPNGKIAVAVTVTLLVAFGLYWYFTASSKSPGASNAKTAAASRFNYELPQSQVYAQYAGSKSCHECHAQAYTNWVTSNHGLAERPLSPSMDQAAFDPPQKFTHGTQTSEARINRGRYEIVTKGLDGVKPFAAERVIGENPLRQYLITAPGGRLQVAEVASDPNKGDWFNVYGNEDRQPGEWGHWTGRGMTWNVMCANCHNTRLRKNFVNSEDVYETAMVEMGVGCESCHGPLASHVDWQKKHPLPPGVKDPARKDPTLINLSTNQYVDVCGMCHARRGELTGDFVPGHSFTDHHMLVIPDETDVYYPDGQVRDEDYEYGSFLGSRMRFSKVACLDCHEPHLAKPRLKGNALCLKCHSAPVAPAPKIDPVTHSHHKIGTVGDLCTDCHMPTTFYMQRHPRHDHGFTIPDPLLTKQFNIPNACNRCHTNQTQTVEWSIKYVDEWYGKKMERPYRTRAQIIARARNGDNTVLPELIKVAQEEQIPYWRAVAVGLLRRWTHEPKTYPVFIAAAKDPDPMVRSIASRGLEMLVGQNGSGAQAALQTMLTDTSRVVRVEAAWTLRASLDTNTTAGSDLLRYLTHNADQPSGLMQLGVLRMDRGDGTGALACFKQAVSWDAGSAPLRHALAVSYSIQGLSHESVKELEIACKLAPRDAEYRFKLGLAYNETGRPGQALTCLEEAAKLDPLYPQAWYNLGLARSAANNPEGALEALSHAENLSTTSAQIPYARATIYARLGRVREARLAANRALELQPGHQDAVQLLRMLPEN